MSPVKRSGTSSFISELIKVTLIQIQLGRPRDPCRDKLYYFFWGILFSTLDVSL